jgi:hypothetical protein
MSNLKNKGTGAGGKNTNKNGLSFEEKTDINKILNIEHTKIKFDTGVNDYYTTFYVEDNPFIRLYKRGLIKYMKNKQIVNEYPLEPDECILDEKNECMYIIEKKFQQVSGSTDEKIQTGLFKTILYSEHYPDYKVVYIYVLSNWFKQEKYKRVLKYLNDENIPVLFVDINYMQNLFDIIAY